MLGSFGSSALTLTLSHLRRERGSDSLARVAAWERAGVKASLID
jgi:hypothetical protein